MPTLDRWLHFLSPPVELNFRELTLMGRDFSPPIAVGSGTIRIPDLNRFEYSMRARVDDPAYAQAAFLRQHQNPYDALSAFRLFGIDTEGTEWTLGWTVPAVRKEADQWHFSDDLQGICPHDNGDSVSSRSDTELVFVIPRNHPAALSIARFATAENDGSRYSHELSALGSTIRFTYDSTRSALFISATHSSDLPPTLTENWLGEPLRILFGDLLYPRLVARNLGERRSHIFVRRSPQLARSKSWVALWGREWSSQPKEALWTQYADLLSLIARARGKDGHPNFEANKITQLYEEVIQSSNGTRWVWALTFASSIEGLVDMLGLTGQPRGDVDEAAKTALLAHIKSWLGDDRLKNSAVQAVQRSSKLSTVDVLRKLAADGAISKYQLDAWQEIRNSVMHGNLVSPYSTEEEDNKLLALIELLHSLTRAVLKRGSTS